jgi:tRNA dimethylallyltransferase
MNLISILGPTCSGKSDLAISIAHKLGNSCVISCDSRQVYKDLDIGTAKVEGEWTNGVFVSEGTDHYLIDFVNPSIEYNLADYIRDFGNLMIELDKSNKYQTIILAGGTGLYAKAIIENTQLGQIKPVYEQEFQSLKKSLSSLTLQELQTSSNSLGIKLNNSDYNNPIRLISNILKYTAKTGNWLESTFYYQFQNQTNYLISSDKEELQAKITSKTSNRFSQGIIEETKSILHLGKDRIYKLGLEYKLCYQFLEGEITEGELKSRITTANLQYAKRQNTWFKAQPNLICMTKEDILNQFQSQS